MLLPLPPFFFLCVRALCARSRGSTAPPRLWQQHFMAHTLRRSPRVHLFLRVGNAASQRSDPVSYYPSVPRKYFQIFVRFPAPSSIDRSCDPLSAHRAGLAVHIDVDRLQAWTSRRGYVDHELWVADSNPQLHRSNRQPRRLYRACSCPTPAAAAAG